MSGAEAPRLPGGFDPGLWPTNARGFQVALSHGAAAMHAAIELGDTVRFVPGLPAGPGSRLGGRFVHRERSDSSWQSDDAAHRRVVQRIGEVISLVAGSLALRQADQNAMGSHGYLMSVVAQLVAMHLELHRGLLEWDEVAWELATPKSIWDLRDGTRRDIGRKDFHLHNTGIEPGVLGSAARWLGVLDTAFGGDSEQRRWFESLLGGAVLGHNDEQLLCWLIGRSGTGKSTIMSVILRVLGSYATVGDSTLLVRDTRQTGSRSSQTERFLLSALERRRVVVFEEIREKHGVLNTALIKKIVSSAEIMIEEKYAAPRAVRLHVSPWLVTNALPDKGLDGDDGEAVLRRLGLVSADGRPGVIEPGLGDWIVEHQAPGVLAWLIDCAVRHYLLGPMKRPEMSDLVSRDFTEEGRPVEDWFAERVEFTGKQVDKLHASVMWQDFKERGTQAVSRANFYMKLSALIVEEKGQGDRTLRNEQLDADERRGLGFYGVKWHENVEKEG